MSEQIENFTREDLQGYIDNEIQESLHLDYERSNSLESNQHNRNEISKDVSAFANSDGGLIIYGIIEENHLPQGLDDGILSAGKREGF